MADTRTYPLWTPESATLRPASCWQDPMAKRKADKAAVKATEGNSFASVAELWLSHWRAGKSERHADTTSRRLETNVYPLLGKRPIADIEAPELVAMVKTYRAARRGGSRKESLGDNGADIPLQHRSRVRKT